MKKILFALLFTLLFTGCIERGQDLQPTPAHTASIKIKPAQATSEIKPIKFENSKIAPNSTLSLKKNDTVSPEETVTKINTSEIIPHTANKNIKDEPIFPLTDETKNKISGFFIFVIGIIILL